MRRTAFLLAVLAVATTTCRAGGGASASGTPIPTADPSPSRTAPTPRSIPAGSVLVGGQARLVDGGRREAQLGCAFTLGQLPEGDVRIRVETLGRGADDGFSLRTGEVWRDGALSQQVRPDQVVIFRTIEDPAGDYGCRILAVETEDGPVPFEGTATALSSVSVAPQHVLDFVADFPRAVRDDDRDFLLATLHPEVLKLYGGPQCQAYLAGGFADPTFALSLLRVRGPKAYDYRADGREVTVPDTWELLVSATSSAGAGKGWVHYAEVGGRLTWFIDCGDPLA